MTAPSTGVRVWALGQAGFVLRSADRTVVIDPWLSDWLERDTCDSPNPVVRAASPPCAPADVPAPDPILCSHEHPDHMDPGTLSLLASAHPSAVVVVPEPAVGIADMMDVAPDRVVGARVDMELDVGGAAPDVAIVAINGRDWRREAAGIVGNLSARDAAELAAAAGLGLTVPCHFDGVAGNTEEPAIFEREMSRRHPDGGYTVLAPGAYIEVIR